MVTLDAIQFISVLTSAEHVARDAQQLSINNIPTKHDFDTQKISIHSFDRDNLNVYINSVELSNQNDRMGSEGITRGGSTITRVLTVASSHPQDLARLHFLQDEHLPTRFGFFY